MKFNFENATSQNSTLKNVSTAVHRRHARQRCAPYWLQGYAVRSLKPFSPFSGQFVTYSPRVLEIRSAKFLGLSDFRGLSDFHAPLAGLAFGKFTVLARRTKQGRTLVSSGPFRVPFDIMKLRYKNGAISCS